LIVNNTIPALKEQTGASNLEDAFLALVKEKNLETNSREAELAKQAARVNSKLKVIKQLRVASLIVIVIGIAVIFIPTFKQYSMIGNTIVIIGALGAVVSRIYLKKYKK